MSDTGGELFDRWLAHREGSAEAEPVAPPAGVPADGPAAVPSEQPDADAAPESPRSPRGPDSTAAGAAVLAALGQSRPAPAKPPRPARPAQQSQPARPALAPSEATLAAARRLHETTVKRPPAAKEPEVPRDYTFAPRRGTRNALTVALLGWVAASIAMGVVSYEQRTSTWYIITGLAVFLTAITWALRAGTAVARLRVVGGILQIQKAGRTDVFSLIDDFQVIDVVGRPGGMSWQVHFLRAGLEPYVVDSSMVSPHEFMRVLAYYRPGMRR